MPDPSTIPAAKAALLAAIQARSALATAYVAWAGPTAPSQIAQPDRVYLTDTIDISRVWSGIGQQRIVETYTLVRLSALTSRSPRRSAAARCRVTFRTRRWVPETTTTGSLARSCTSTAKRSSSRPDHPGRRKGAD
jgi:hypothetical protein